mmetsp:Transcript_42431/g.123314  ORF Transcript_42431/g.123314 Transcript_42431/m.123314 type:complete len:85 (+) Transcript_42431:670-924(+)
MTYRTARCFQNRFDASSERQPSAAGKKPPAQIKTTAARCTGRMKEARPSVAASVENGSIQTADNCINGVMTVLLAELKAQSVNK